MLWREARYCRHQSPLAAGFNLSSTVGDQCQVASERILPRSLEASSSLGRLSTAAVL